MKQSILTSICGLLLAITLASCSTTAKLPDDEQLYVGISKIDYSDTPPTSRKVRRDSVGVITTISDAVHAVGAALSGQGSDGLAEKLKQDAKGTGTTKEELAAAKKAEDAELAVNKAALATAQTEVEAVLAYPPNNALFGSSYHRSPLQLGLWFYTGFVDAKTRFGKWIYKCFATQPIYVSSVSPEMRVKVAQNTLQNYGFFKGRVSYEVINQKNPKKAKIGYHVLTGPLSRLDSIAFYPYTAGQDSLLERARGKTLLRRGDAFSVVNLANEQTRVGNLFRENGYYYWQDAYTTYQADTLQRANWVQLRVMPKRDVPTAASHPWYIGDAVVNVRRQERDALDQTRSRRHFTYNYSGQSLPLRGGMWRQAITHRHGEPYRASDQKTTLEKLNSIGVFSMLDVNYVPRDTSALCDTLDVYISALMDKRFDSDFEMNATLKSNQQVGPGFSYAINKRNAFRGGETVSFKLYGSYEWQFGARTGNDDLLNSYELGSQLSFTFPRFFAPFISQRRLRFPAETVLSIDADWKRRAGFFTLVSAGLGATYNWHKHSNLLHELTPLSIDFDNTINTSSAFDSIMAANPALNISMRDQFIPAMAYTLTYSSAATHRNPLFLQLTAKEAGNLVSGIYAATGRPFNQRDKKLLGSPFAQFLKSTAEIHYTVPLNGRFTLATRFFGGILWAYGNSQRAPYSEQFYVGGANSVRGFTVRSIGPGKYRSDNSKYSYIDQTGDVKLEANAELRAHLFGSLYGAVFLDAGNVWLLRKDEARPGAELSASTLKHIALGTGAGLRYDLEFLVLRFDVGIGLHAPYETSRGGFYNLEKFRDGLNFHFAIGYPF